MANLLVANIRQSIAMNSTFNLYTYFYRLPSSRCRKYVEDEDFRKFTGEEQFVENRCTVMASEALLMERPLAERMDVYGALQKERMELSDRVDHPWGGATALSEVQWLELKEELDALLDEFERKFLD